jgi:hypothetical protein
VSGVTDEARDLIDIVADAIDDFDDRKAKYAAGREIIMAYHAMHPNSIYAVGQASKYLLLRVRRKEMAQ